MSGSCPGPRRVLVITKHRFLGDTIVATPLMRAIPDAFPGASVAVLTGRPAATILQNLPCLERVYAFGTGTGARSVSGSLKLSLCLVKLARQIRHEFAPDTTLVVDRSFRAAAGASLTGARVRAGFDCENRGWLLTHRIPYDPDAREVRCCLDILRAIAPNPTQSFDETPTLCVTPDEQATARTYLAPGGKRPWIGIQPGASHDWKTWPLERFVRVGDALAAQGAQIVLVGGPDEVHIAKSMRAAMRCEAEVLDLTGKTSLRETMAVLTELDLFVGNDTGINHTAAALGVATIALFGPTPAGKWANPGVRHQSLIARDSRMESIPTEDVLAAAETLLPACRAAAAQVS